MDQQQDNQQPQTQVMDIQPPQPAPAPTETIAPSQPLPQQSAASQDNLTENPLAIKPAAIKTKQSRGPIGIIIVAVLVAIGLGYLAFSLYQKGNTRPVSNETPQSQQSPAADIDSTTSEVDTSLESINEASDFNENDLSDSSLGL